MAAHSDVFIRIGTDLSFNSELFSMLFSSFADSSLLAALLFEMYVLYYNLKQWPVLYSCTVRATFGCVSTIPAAVALLGV